MPGLNANEYDAVIIGAGIGGLVCGCYLAKAGMKVLIAEQHFKPGGYCTSFKRGKFTFDAAAHSFGGYRKDGIVRKVFRDLGLDMLLNIKRYDPSDIIMSPDYKISFRSDVAETIKDFISAFPLESDNIEKFFHFLNNPSPISFARMRNWTFRQLLDHYFLDNKLKTILAFPLLGNGGLPPSLMSAFTGSKIFTEFLLDGGYYPEGGMQALPIALVGRFKELGGELRLSCLVKQIVVRDGKVAGVHFENNDFISSRYVVSNCDAMQTFSDLLGSEVVSKEILNEIETMSPSLSMFVLYLGVDNNTFQSLHQPGTNLWILNSYDIEQIYSKINKGHFDEIDDFMMRISPDNQTILAFVNAPFKSRAYWTSKKGKLTEIFIKGIMRNVLPDLTKHLIFRDAATPYTLYRYTLNYKGAAYGWSGIPSQSSFSRYRCPSFINGLYLTGHWITQVQGIPGVIYIGYDTAKMISRK
jgi:phytoene dehydrogenase-like protein